MEQICSLSLAQEIPPRFTGTPVATGVARHIQVLLVEDDQDAALLTAAALHQDGLNEEEPRFGVEWAENLSVAMVRLSRPKSSQAGIDVILLDLGMPELNGYKSCRAIQAAVGSKLPIVILTSDNSDISRILTLGYGATAYLLKSDISPARLRWTLRNAAGL